MGWDGMDGVILHDAGIRKGMSSKFSRALPIKLWERAIVDFQSKIPYLYHKEEQFLQLSKFERSYSRPAPCDVDGQPRHYPCKSNGPTSIGNFRFSIVSIRRPYHCCICTLSPPLCLSLSLSKSLYFGSVNLSPLRGCRDFKVSFFVDVC